MTIRKIAFIVLNYNSQELTIRAVKSVCSWLFSAQSLNCRVIIVDNHSEDGEWEGLADLGKHGGFGLPVTFIRNSRNTGYAEGNDVGLRIAFGSWNADFSVILNPDAQIDAKSDIDLFLGELAVEADLFGAPIYNENSLFCVGGGQYLPLTTSTRYNMSMADVGKTVTRQMFYLSGAFLCIPAKWYETVGPMSRDYFLYFEEIDWIFRARVVFQREPRLHVIRGITIRHDVGGSTGNKVGIRKSPLSDYYSARSRIIFTKHWMPYSLGNAIIANNVLLISRLFSGQYKNAFAIFKAIVDGLANRISNVYVTGG